MDTICQSVQERMDLLDQKAVEKCIPLNAHLDMTYKCNLNCIHCYVVRDRTRSELDYSEIIHLLDQLADAGCLWLALSGGEILTRDDFFAIAAYAKKKNFALRLFTNGTLIDPKIADRLSDLSPVAVDISLYGVRETTHDTITKCKGSWQKTLRAIDWLRERKIRVILKTPLMKANIHEVEDLFALSKKLGVEHMFDVQMCPKENGSLEPTRYQLNPDELLAYFLNDIPQRVEYVEEPPLTRARQKPVCSPATNSCAISAYGDLRPCSILPLSMGNIRTATFKQLWHSQNPQVRQLRNLQHYQELTPCSKCRWVFHCQRCHGLAELFQGDYLGCDPLGLAMAKVKKKVNDIRKKERSCKVNHLVRENPIVSLH